MESKLKYGIKIDFMIWNNPGFDPVLLNDYVIITVIDNNGLLVISMEQEEIERIKSKNYELCVIEMQAPAFLFRSADTGKDFNFWESEELMNLYPRVLKRFLDLFDVDEVNK